MQKLSEIWIKSKGIHVEGVVKRTSSNVQDLNDRCFATFGKNKGDVIKEHEVVLPQSVCVYTHTVWCSKEKRLRNGRRIVTDIYVHIRRLRHSCPILPLDPPLPPLRRHFLAFSGGGHPNLNLYLLRCINILPFPVDRPSDSSARASVQCYHFVHTVQLCLSLSFDFLEREKTTTVDQAAFSPFRGFPTTNKKCTCC